MWRELTCAESLPSCNILELRSKCLSDFPSASSGTAASGRALVKGAEIPEHLGWQILVTPLGLIDLISTNAVSLCSLVGDHLQPSSLPGSSLQFPWCEPCYRGPRFPLLNPKPLLEIRLEHPIHPIN